MTFRRPARAAVTLVLAVALGGCSAVIQPYRGIPKGAQDDKVIRDYKYAKHAVDVTLVTVTTYYQGGGASTQTYRTYEVAGFNYALDALPAYFKASGQEKASSQLARGILITKVALPCIYAGSGLLIAAGIGLVATGPKPVTGSDDEGSGYFGRDYNYGLIIAGAVALYAGPWLLDKITWGGYIKPAIEKFNGRMQNEIKVGLAPAPGGAVAAVAMRF